jgi:hypothetical protein
MENNYKNMTLVVGPTMNSATGKYDFVTSNYTDGLTKEDTVAAGNIIINSSYPTAIGTAEGGYLAKQFFASYSNIVLADPRTDCGTTKTIEITLTSDNIDWFVFQYMKEGSKFVLLTDENKKQYLGKSVQFRTPMYCISDKPCNRCCGEMMYKLNIRNAGLTVGTISGVILNRKLKAKHDTTVKQRKVDVSNLVV